MKKYVVYMIDTTPARLRRFNTMDNNAHVSMTLEDLLNIMDARRNIDIFSDADSYPIFTGYVYEVLADKKFSKAHNNKPVVGLTTCLNHTAVLLGGKK